MLVVYRVDNSYLKKVNRLFIYADKLIRSWFVLKVLIDNWIGFSTLLYYVQHANIEFINEVEINNNINYFDLIIFDLDIQGEPFKYDSTHTHDLII